MSRRITALKRIANDLKALDDCPLEGIGIASIDEDPFRYVINMELMTGIYEGYKVQLLMTIPEDYPIKPPKILIYPNQTIGSGYHHHIFSASSGYKKFCIDFLDNEFNMDTNAEHTGWNPAYTISSILLQVQNFIGDPDMHHLPDKAKIERLMNSMNSYERDFMVKEQDKNVKIHHTWKDPYPKMYYSNEPKNEIKMDVYEERDSRTKETIKENLTCYLLRENYIDNPEILLGYPIIQSKSVYGKDKIELYPIPQLLTYEAYQMQMTSMQVNQSNLINSFYVNNNNTANRVKAANNEYFNTWLPIYVDEQHYTKNKTTIFNSIKSIKNEITFKPEQIFDILPIILNKMIIGMFNGKSRISSAFIVCYFQYVLLFKRLCKEYKDEYESYMNKKIGLITMNDYEVNKKIIPDIGDFLMLTFLSNKDMTTPEMKKMKNVLIQEFLIRQVYWIFHGPDCKDTMKQKIVNGSLRLNDDVYLDLFHSDPNLKMRHLDIFNNELHRQQIYTQVINIISNDRDFKRNYKNNWKYAKRMAEERISKSFKRLYNEVSTWSRNKLRDLIKENMHFSDFFEEDETLMRDRLYESFQVDELLKNNENSHDMGEILKYAYESQKGNQLLLITFAVLKKLGEEGFIAELERDHGIFVKVDAFVEDIKKSLKDVKSYKELYDCIGTDIGNGKSELELIIDAYEEAKKKRYIRDPNEKNKVNENRYTNGYDYGNGYGYGNRYGYNRRW